MTIKIKQTDSLSDLNRKISKISRRKPGGKTNAQFDPFKYVGKLKGVFGDGLEYQKKTRSEW